MVRELAWKALLVTSGMFLVKMKAFLMSFFGDAQNSVNRTIKFNFSQILTTEKQPHINHRFIIDCGEIFSIFYRRAVKQKPQNRLKCKSVVASRQVVVVFRDFWSEWRVECVLMRFVSLSNAHVMMCNLKRQKKTVNYIISWWLNAANVSLPIAQSSQPREPVALKSYERQSVKCKLLHRSFVLRWTAKCVKGGKRTWKLLELHSKRLSQRNTTSGLILRFRAHVSRKLNHQPVHS